MVAPLTLTLVTLSACVPKPVVPPPPPAPTAAEQQATLAQGLAALPGAVVDAKDPLTVNYPGEVLFLKGAVLPFPGGVEMLDPLAKLIQGNPQFVWTGVVKAETGVSAEYDLTLAKKRSELLGRYFQARGITAKIPTLRSEGGAGAPLTLTATLQALPAAATKADKAAPSKP